MPATIRDVAQRAGVGIGTVSSVLNNSRPVNESTRQKVLLAINELNFVPNPSGRRLSMGKTHSIAVIIPYFTIFSQFERLRGVMSVVNHTDYDVNLMVVESVSQRNKVMQNVSHRGRVDGLIMFSLQPTPPELDRLRAEQLPVVLVEAQHPNVPHISIDDTAGARMAVEHLLSLGHRKIAYLSDYFDDPMANYFSYHRYEGYCEALRTAGIPVRAGYHLQHTPNQEGGRQMALELLHQTDPPTAIFTFCDELALGVLATAREMALDVPTDLSVISYDDIELARFAQLTTIRQHLFESGVRGVELLLEVLENTAHPPASSQLVPELIVRQTTAPPAVERV